jgi:uncharacterized repeat protein (TIGR03803 family)
MICKKHRNRTYSPKLNWIQILCFLNSLSFIRKMITLFTTFICCSHLTFAQYTKHELTTNSSFTGFEKIFDFEKLKSGYTPREIIISGNTIYGYTCNGGTVGVDLLFKMKTDGSDYQKFEFNTNINAPTSIVLSNSIIYGTALSGGIYDSGIIFRYNIDGTGFKILHNFMNIGYTYPWYNIIVVGNVIYGIEFSRNYGYGNIFQINTDGTGYRRLKDITGLPWGRLLIFDNYLYGTTFGYITTGKIFKIKTDGTEYTELHLFNNPENGLNSLASLTIGGTTLYGTTSKGGINDRGIVFKINTDGTNYKKLYDIPVDGIVDASYGSGIWNKLILSGSDLYGIARYGDINNNGILFSLNVDGSNFQKLYDFKDAVNGASPTYFTMSGDTIFGTTYLGGLNNNGVIYKYVIDKSHNTFNEKPRTFYLPIEIPDQITVLKKKYMTVEKGVIIDLDTAFLINASISTTKHDWKVKAGVDYELIDKIAKITQDTTFYVFISTDQGCSYTESVTVGVKDFVNVTDVRRENQFRIYPNPFSDRTRIMCHGSETDPYILTISDMTGKIVRKINGIRQIEFQLSREGLKSGLYIIEIRGSKTYRAKLVIE